MYEFELKRPRNMTDALQALAAEDAQILGGGQTLIPTMKARLSMTETLVALSGIEDIKGVCRDDAGRVCIGGGTTHAAVARACADIYPALASLAGRIGDPAVRTRGTIGGSLANNDPSACWPAAALALGATVVTHLRKIAAEDYFQGMFATALDDAEIITEVCFPVPVRAAYEKFIQPASRFPLVAVFVAQFDDAVRVAVTGAAADGVFRWTAAETALTTQFAPGALDGVALPDAGDMLSDLHGDGSYRAHLVGVMTRRAVVSAGGQ